MSDTMAASPITDIQSVPVGTRITYLGGGSDRTSFGIIAEKPSLWRGEQENGSWRLVFGYDTYPGELASFAHGRGKDQGFWYVSNTDAACFGVATAPEDTDPIADFGSLAVGTRLRLDGGFAITNPLYKGVWEVVRHDTDQSTSCKMVEQANPDPSCYPTVGTQEWFWWRYPADHLHSAKAFCLVEPVAEAPREPVVLASVSTKVFGDPGVTVMQYLVPPSDTEVEFAYALNAASVAEAQVATLRREVMTARRTAEQAVDAYKDQVRDYIMSIKDSHGWCNSGTSRHLEAIGIRSVDQDYDVTVTCTYTYTMSVTAADEDEAGTMVTDDIDSYVSFSTQHDSWDEVTIDSVNEA